MSRIYLSSPDISELEEKYILHAIRSGWIAPLGPDVDAFEREVCDRTGVPHAVALSSGTAALHLALVSWGVGPGDVVPTSTLTFAATANAITYTGATPLFVDVDPSTGNIDVELLDHALNRMRDEGKNVPCVLPVDLLGKTADYTAIQRVATRHQVRVLADSAESMGANHAGRESGALGDAAVFSFNGNKIMTTSGGGMLLTHDRKLADHVRFLAAQAREPHIHYEHRELGFNYRMSNLLAALGRAQLARLESMISKRRTLREHYASLFSGIPGVRIFGRPGDEHDNFWLTAILVDPSLAGWQPMDLLQHLALADIEARPLWKPMHQQPLHRRSPHSLTGAADSLYTSGLSLPSGSSLTPPEIDRVSSTISDFLHAPAAP